VELRKVNIHTVQFAHILDTSDLDNLRPFLSQTAFVISHKSESVEALLRVLWYIPTDSSIIIVTNCPEGEYPHFARELQTQLRYHKNTYFVHQKDEHIAHLFNMYNVNSILGADGKVVDGKGEGMYIGALCAHQLNYPRWLIFYDADNFVPSALLEYTMAMSRLFVSPPSTTHCRECQTPIVNTQVNAPTTFDLHNVRICWASKPELGTGDWKPGITGRTTQVVSPLLNSLREDLFGPDKHTISSSNAGEQGMTINTAISLRFSSGFSVETFQLLDLLFKANQYQRTNHKAMLYQYISQSPHFHEKKGDNHIKQMIEESLGGFFYFADELPDKTKQHLERIYQELDLELVCPVVYPALQTLGLQKNDLPMKKYALFTDELLQGEKPLTLGVKKKRLTREPLLTEKKKRLSRQLVSAEKKRRPGKQTVMLNDTNSQDLSLPPVLIGGEHSPAILPILMNIEDMPENPSALIGDTVFQENQPMLINSMLFQENEPEAFEQNGWD